MLNNAREPKNKDANTDLVIRVADADGALLVAKAGVEDEESDALSSFIPEASINQSDIGDKDEQETATVSSDHRKSIVWNRDEDSESHLWSSEDDQTEALQPSLFRTPIRREPMICSTSVRKYHRASGRQIQQRLWEDLALFPKRCRAAAEAYAALRAADADPVIRVADADPVIRVADPVIRVADADPVIRVADTDPVTRVADPVIRVADADPALQVAVADADPALQVAVADPVTRVAKVDGALPDADADDDVEERSECCICGALLTARPCGFTLCVDGPGQHHLCHDCLRKSLNHWTAVAWDFPIEIPCPVCRGENTHVRVPGGDVSIDSEIWEVKTFYRLQETAVARLAATGEETYGAMVAEMEVTLELPEGACASCLRALAPTYFYSYRHCCRRHRFCVLCAVCKRRGDEDEHVEEDVVQHKGCPIPNPMGEGELVVVRGGTAYLVHEQHVADAWELILDILMEALGDGNLELNEQMLERHTEERLRDNCNGFFIVNPPPL